MTTTHEGSDLNTTTYDTEISFETELELLREDVSALSLDVARQNVALLEVKATLATALARKLALQARLDERPSFTS